MSDLQFIAALVNALAWPVAVTVAAVLLRKEIRDAVRRILHLRFPGGEVTFALAPIAAALAATTGDSGPEGTEAVRSQAAGFDQLEELAEWAPAQAIIFAWGLLEYQLNAASDRIAPHQAHGWPQVALNLRRLDKWPLLYPAITELRRLRDYTAAESGYPPSTADAVRYVSLAQDLVTTLRTAGVAEDEDGDDHGEGGGEAA